MFGDDWFEVTNGGATTADITGWRMDDNHNNFRHAVPLSGITQIAPGESVIFIEDADLATASAGFVFDWFNSKPPTGLQIGNYSEKGVDLSTDGDQVNLFDSTGSKKAIIASLLVLPKDHQFFRPLTIRPVSTPPPSRSFVL